MDHEHEGHCEHGICEDGHLMFTAKPETEEEQEDDHDADLEDDHDDGPDERDEDIIPVQFHAAFVGTDPETETQSKELKFVFQIESDSLEDEEESDEKISDDRPDARSKIHDDHNKSILHNDVTKDDKEEDHKETQDSITGNNYHQSVDVPDSSQVENDAQELIFNVRYFIESFLT